ncbi:MAG: GNAT family N-acetyltransferase [Bacteroidetes bacterium]|nr:GNAT family N-acetyltransferase [Bacteroidota bacterium]
MLPIIENDHYYLKAVQESDAAFLHRLLNSEDWIRNIGDRKVPTVEATRKLIREKLIPGMSNNYGPYVIRRKLYNKEMGTVGLMYRDYTNTPDIGYALLPEYFGQGYAFGAAQLIVQHARNNWEIKQIGGMVIPENIPSIKILEKLGLRYKHAFKEPGTNVQLWWFES